MHCIFQYPLPGIVVIHQDETYLKDVLSLESYILAELNVRNLTVTTDMFKYGVTRRAEPDYKTLGTRLRGSFKAVTQAVKVIIVISKFNIKVIQIYIILPAVYSELFTQIS